MANKGTRINMVPIRILGYMADRDYKLSATKIAEGLGIETRQSTSALQSLKVRKMVISTGLGKGMVWGLAPDPVVIKVDQKVEPSYANDIPQLSAMVEHQYSQNQRG